MPEPAKTKSRSWSGLAKFAKSPSHLYPLAFLLAYAVLFGLYDLRQVPKQRAAILEQNFRRLALASDQIRSRLENIAQVMRAEDERRNFSNSGSKTPAEKRRKPMEDAGSATNFSFLTDCKPASEQQEGISFQVLPGDKPAVLAVLKERGDPICGESQLQPTIESATRNLVGAGFSDVAVITSVGRVIYQRQSSALRLATLGDLPSAIRSGKLSNPDDKVSTGSGKESPGANGGVSYSRVADLSFAEQRYKLLLQPIIMPIADVASGSSKEAFPSLELVGIIDDESLTAAARALPYDWLINVTGGILLALVLTWPVLKIWKMGPAEGFRSRETLAFGLSMIAVAMLVTILAYYNSQVLSYQSTDKALDGLADSIDANFKKEITTALETLTQVSATAEVTNKLKSEDKSFQAIQSVLLHQDVLRPEKTPAPYVWFDQIFWTDDEGYQLLKWSTQATATRRTKVTEEAWFQKAAQGRFWTLSDHSSESDEFVLDSLYSPNTTDYFGMLAKVQKHGTKTIVAAMVTPFVSVINPLLSPMDGYAILDETGLVRFHSDTAKNLRENFLNEISPAADAQSAMSARGSTRMTVAYQAKKYRMVMRPLSFERNEAWTLVVFHDLTLRQRFFLNTLVLTIIYAVSYLLALTGLCLAGAWLIRFTAAQLALLPKEDWLRPTANERIILWALAALFGSLLLLFRVLTGPDCRQFQYLTTVIALPLTGLLAAYFALRYPSALGSLHSAALPKNDSCDPSELACAIRKAEADKIRRRLGASSVFAITGTLLLTLVAVFPSAEFFEIAYSDAVVPNMQDMQIGTARNILARNDRIYAYVRRLPSPEGSDLTPDGQFLKKRLSEVLDRYTLPQTLATDDAAPAVFECWLPDPARNHWRAVGETPQASWLFSHTQAVLKNLLPFPEAARDSRSAKQAWSWKQDEWKNNSVLEMLPPKPDPQDRRTEDDSAKRQGVPAAASDFPITNALRSFPHRGDCGVMVLVLISLLFCFIRYTVLHRLGLDVRPVGEPIKEESLMKLAEETKCNVLALSFPRCIDAQKTLANLSTPVQVFPLESLLTGNSWKNRLYDQTDLIVLTNFEDGIKKPQNRMKTLELLEEIVEDPKRKLLLISTVDPVYYLYTGWLKDIKKLLKHELETYSRWLNVFNSFETRRVTPDKSRELNREDWHALWDTCSEREQLALWQLANYRVINPKNTSAVEHLFRRGLLSYVQDTENFEISDKGYKDFIISEPTSRQIELLTNRHKDTAWNGLKLVLLYTLMTLFLFLAFTNADFWDLGLGKLMTFASAGAAALPTISKIASLAGVKFGKDEAAG